MNRLGIIDWGIGGISVYRLIKEQVGDVSVTYFSDTGVTPYGKMSRAELASRLDTVIEFLKTQDVSHVVIGCNAASTAIPYLSDHRIPVNGVILPAVELTAKLDPSDLGLIGGRRTVVSGVYRMAFAAKKIGVRQRIAQPLSGFIESGDVSSDKLRGEAKRILSPLKKCSHILLACTHYPAITPLLAEFVSPKTKFIDPASSLVTISKNWKLSTEGNDVFYTSGNAAAMKTAAGNAFGVNIKRVKTVDITRI